MNLRRGIKGYSTPKEDGATSTRFGIYFIFLGGCESVKILAFGTSISSFLSVNMSELEHLTRCSSFISWILSKLEEIKMDGPHFIRSDG